MGSDTRLPEGFLGRLLALVAAAGQVASAFLPWAADGRTALDVALTTWGGTLRQPTVALALVALAALPAVEALVGDRGWPRGVSGLLTGLLVLGWLAFGPDGAVTAGPAVAMAATALHLLGAALARGTSADRLEAQAATGEAPAQTPVAAPEARAAPQHDEPREDGGGDSRGASLPPVAATGFARDPALYERGRPDYPLEAVEHLVTALGLGPGSRVVEVGAGTGKLTRLLVATGADIVAIEPVEEMREALLDAVPEVDARPGLAEDLPLPGDWAKAIVVGQAFHWFDGPAALAEFHRVLRPGGGLGLIWNTHDRDHARWPTELKRRFERYARDVPQYSSGAWREALEASTHFEPLEYHVFPNVVDTDVERAVARVLSTSHVAALDDAVRAGVADEVRDFLATHPETQGRVRFPEPYLTEVYVTRARTAAR